MSNTLTITTSLVDDHWEISGFLSEGTLPTEVFIYTNSGNKSLGEYAGTCSLSELTRLRVFTGEIIPIFANKFIRHNSLRIVVGINEDVPSIIDTIVTSITNLMSAYRASTNTTQVYTIL